MVEWTGVTPAVRGENFTWTDHVVCDMTEASFIRIELAGANGFVAMSETKDHLAKKVNYAFGTYCNTKNYPAWIPKG